MTDILNIPLVALKYLIAFETRSLSVHSHRQLTKLPALEVSLGISTCLLFIVSNEKSNVDKTEDQILS